jgi:hypothetical protein
MRMYLNVLILSLTGARLNKQSLLQRIDAIEQQLQDMRTEIVTDDAAEEEIVEVANQGPWRRQMLEKLYPHIEQLPGVIALLDLTAEHAPEYVPYEEVKRRSGLTDRQQRNDHAALTRMATKVLGQRTWPVAWQQTAAGPMRYWMPVRMAAWWRELRKGC